MNNKSVLAKLGTILVRLGSNGGFKNGCKCSGSIKLQNFAIRIKDDSIQRTQAYFIYSTNPLTYPFGFSKAEIANDNETNSNIKKTIAKRLQGVT